MKTKKWAALGAAVAIVLSVVTGCSSTQSSGGSQSPGSQSGASQQSARSAQVAFATSGQGGTFYTAGAGIAAFTTEQVDGLSVTAETTKGVVENMRLLAAGETEMGFAYGSTAYDISNGTGVFEGQQYDGIRAVCNIHDGAINIVSLRDSGIAALPDLEGKRISIGPKGSGSADVAEQLLKSAGLMEKVDLQYLSFDDSASAIRDGHIDVMIIGGTTPVPALVELEASKALNFIPVDGTVRDKFLQEYPYHVSYTIPADGYSSLSTAVETVGYSVIWVADKSVDEWIVYEMLKATLSEEGKTYLQNVQAAFKEMQPGLERFELIELPLHPGAEKYYREIGLIS